MKYIKILLVTGLLFFAPFVLAESQEEDCYQLVLEDLGEIPLGNYFSEIAPDSISSEKSIWRESAESILPFISFTKPIFGTKVYSFGEESELKRSNLFKMLELIKIQDPSVVDDQINQFEFVSFYDLEDKDFLGCRFEVKNPAGNLDFSEISEDDIGQSGPVKVRSFEKGVIKNDKKYKKIIFEKPKMNLLYTNPVLNRYSVVVIPESDRSDFNGYALSDIFVEKTNSYYSDWLPGAASKVRSRQSKPWRDVERVVLMDVNDLLVEKYIETKITGTRETLTFEAEPITEFGGNMDNIFNYLPRYRDAVTVEMIKTGQTDVYDIFLPYKTGEYQMILANFEAGNEDIKLANLEDDLEDILDIDLVDQLDEFIYQEMILADINGEEEINKSEGVELFWRIKERVDAGESEYEIKNFISEYPAYLEQIQKLETIQNIGNSDIDLSSWYAEFMQRLIELGVMGGYPDGTFQPGRTVNRAEMAKIATALFDIPVSDVSSDPFPDVDADAWYAPFVAAAKDAGVIAGYPDGNFRPSDPVNRAEAMKMLLEASGVEIVASNRARFGDVSPQAWFGPFVNFASSKGVVGGYSDGNFRPAQTVNRAEIAKMAVLLYEMLQSQN